ncbi:hypothetical protein [Ferrimonas marina]|uniref:Uncharacterized protein n=1 Tax=Ferrimonas marina TaxID=299255 RepID=A0A1M5VL27_9GAMM|nr:hypothetical protein [Ferrimonas marina]SHH75927.1 hypothetical protein SAMN02745129_2836 [Ferrimonas marina]
MKHLNLIGLGSALLLSSFTANAFTVETCNLGYRGQISDLFLHESESGTPVLSVIAKLNANKKKGDAAFSYHTGDSVVEKFGTATVQMTSSPTALDPADCNLNSLDRPEGFTFLPLNFTGDNPWEEQFTVDTEKKPQQTLTAVMAEVSDFRGYVGNVSLVAADGLRKIKVEDDSTGEVSTVKMRMPHLFEFTLGNDRSATERQFNPLKYSITKGNGELPQAKAGNRSLGPSGDKAPWAYQLTAISPDGQFVAGFASLTEDVTFNKSIDPNEDNKVLSKKARFAVLWQIKQSCQVNGGSCNNLTASVLTSNTGKLIANSVGRNASNNASNNPDMPLGTFDQLRFPLGNYPAAPSVTQQEEEAMAFITSIVKLDDTTYWIGGQSLDGRAMLAKISL